MKKNTAYTIGSLIILLLCAFVFVALPAFTGSAGKSGTSISFGKYGKKDIAYGQETDMQNFVTHYAQQYQNYGVELDESTYYYIFQYAFNSVVSKYAYADFVNKTGYVVPQEAVNRQMRNYFLDENGNYSSKLYKQASESEVQKLSKDLEESLTTQRFYDDIFGSTTDTVGTEALYGLKESDAEMSFLENLGVEKRGFNIATFALSDYPNEEKVAYGKANAARFAKYDMNVITVDDKATAKTVAKRLASQEITFEDAVSEYSTKKYSSAEGKLTNTYQYQVENILTNKDDVDALYKLNEGDVSDVIETNETFSIFKANTKVQDADFTNDEVVRIVGSYLTNYENSVIEDYFTAKAKDFTSEAMNTSFTQAGEKLGVEVSTVAPFPLNYGNVSIADKIDTSVKGLSSAATNENFLKTAFSLKMNEISSPMVLSNNVVVIQYTQSETAEPSSSVSELSNYDQDSAQSSIMGSSKLENNFTTVYFKNFMNN